MPSSQPGQISPIVLLLQELNPQRILEIGPGFGKYGFLSREYLELWSRQTNYGAHERRIDAIEVFGPYVTPLQMSIYDKIYVGNAVDIVSSIEDYDIILAVDVLEHIEKEAGKRLIQICLAKATFVLASTPKNPAPQAPQFNNAHEAHISAWSKRDLASLAPALFLQEPQSIVALLSLSGERLSEKRSTVFFLNVYQNMPVLVRRLLSLRFHFHSPFDRE